MRGAVSGQETTCVEAAWAWPVRPRRGWGLASGQGPAEAMGRAPAGRLARRQPEGAGGYRVCWGPLPSPGERHRPGRGPRCQTDCCLGLSALLQGSHPQIADMSEGFPKHSLPQDSWTGRLCGSGLGAWAPWRLVPRSQGLEAPGGFKALLCWTQAFCEPGAAEAGQVGAVSWACARPALTGPRPIPCTAQTHPLHMGLALSVMAGVGAVSEDPAELPSLPPGC